MKTFSFVAITILSIFTLLSAGCDDGDPKSDGYVAVDAADTTLFSGYFATMDRKTSMAVPEASLEDYIISGDSAEIVKYIDAAGNVLGFTRHVKTGVGCHDGKCAAVQFYLVYDAAGNWLDIFHPEGETSDFYKGIPGDQDNSILFTSDDWENLKSLLSDPPSILLNLEDRLDMVDATTGATFETYVGSVVPSAAYTTYTCIEYLVNTGELIGLLFTEE
ncbi:hypothetical protein KKF34_06905 [Myxococcota bacterium]|nr:hypothetical protein [Myxococcota bacterium]MBU1381435.1 hypothetical protein [Myxococcota bacterium]MBU1496590.1 hypothetical protein [Myxococcota bacterium]